MKLVLHTQPEVPLEAEVISPDYLRGKTADQVEKLTVFHGNNQVPLSRFFTVTGDVAEDQLEVEGDLSKVKLLGNKMSSGRLIIKGNVGAHLGAEMSGGEILVEAMPRTGLVVKCQMAVLLSKVMPGIWSAVQFVVAQQECKAVKSSYTAMPKMKLVMACAEV